MNSNVLTRAATQDPKIMSLEIALELSDINKEPSTNISLFLFARGVHALQLRHGKDFSRDELQRMFGEWYDYNYDFLCEAEGVDDEMDGFDDLYFDFLEKYERVRVPLGNDFAEAAWQIARVGPYPPEAEQFQQDELKQLTCLCWHMQIASRNEPFFLSCRKVQTLMGLSTHQIAARRLRGLVKCGVLEVVEQGGPKTNKATRYRYVSLFP
jgi:hypothetical protein